MVRMAERKSSIRLLSGPWLAQKMLSYLPAKAWPKLSSSRLLERTMMGDWP
jgi:hypothetical protein